MEIKKLYDRSNNILERWAKENMRGTRERKNQDIERLIVAI